MAIMAVGGVGLGVWLYFSWSDYSAAQAEWEEMGQKSVALENSKVYPSPANARLLQTKISDYRGKFQTLRSVLLGPNLQRPFKPVSETEFQAKLKERAKSVKQKADESVVKLPQNFALGFEEYSDTLPPNADAAAELNVHMDVMEKLVTTLIRARVMSIDDLQRSRLACEKPKGTPATTQPAAQPSAPAQADQVLDRYTIKCTFTSDQGPLQKVLNDLSNPAETPDFLAIRLMRVENEKTEAPSKDEIKRTVEVPPPSSEPPADTKDSKPADADTIAPPKPLPPDARAIIGAETLKTYLEVDYIRFRQPPAEEAAAPKR